MKELPGRPYTVETFSRETLRAELVELINNYTMTQSVKIVDALMRDYMITPARRGYR